MDALHWLLVVCLAIALLYLGMPFLLVLALFIAVAVADDLSYQKRKKTIRATGKKTRSSIDQTVAQYQKTVSKHFR